MYIHNRQTCNDSRRVARHGQRSHRALSGRHAVTDDNDSGDDGDDAAAALAELGLSLPCTAHELGRAFRKRVMADRAHPDQGGSEEEFRELMRLRSLAMAHVEASSSPARPAA